MIASLSEYCERPLGQVVDIEIGRTPSRVNARYWDGTQSWLTISDFDHGDVIRNTKERVTREAVEQCGLKIHEPGTLVMSFKLTIGKLGFLGEPMGTNEAIAALKPNGDAKIDARYLFHYLSNFEFDGLLDRAAKGRTLNKEKLKRVIIRFPQKIEEQRRIAAILDKADTVRRKRERALVMANDFLNSMFLEMFGDPNSNIHRFKLATVESICELITDCLHTTPNHFDEPNAYPSIRSSELQDGYIDLSSAKYVSEAEYHARIQRYRPSVGDTIYCREGARFGNVGIIPEGMTPCLGQRTMLLKANIKVATPEYLWSVMRSQATVRQAEEVVGGAASPHVNIKDIRKFKCTLPPLEVQMRFSKVCQNVFRLRVRLIRQVKEAGQLFSALSQSAFRGEL